MFLAQGNVEILVGKTQVQKSYRVLCNKQLHLSSLEKML